MTNPAPSWPPLPTWEEADLALTEGRASALEIFIHDNEPAGPQEGAFRVGLENLIAEARSAEAGRVRAWADPIRSPGYDAGQRLVIRAVADMLSHPPEVPSDRRSPCPSTI